MTNNLYILSTGLLLIGMFLMGLGKISYRWRAFRNKPAWNGNTLPLFIIGLVLSVIGAILVYIFYPYK